MNWGEEQEYGRCISVLYRYRRSFMTKRLAAYGCAGGLYGFLLCAEQQDGATQEQIASMMRVDKATVCKGLQKLESAGYVRREVDENDRRALRVRLTEAGRAVLPAVHAAMRQWDELVTGELPGEERAALYALLRRLAQKAESAAADLPAAGR